MSFKKTEDIVLFTRHCSSVMQTVALMRDFPRSVSISIKEKNPDDFAHSTPNHFIVKIFRPPWSQWRYNRGIGDFGYKLI